VIRQNYNRPRCGTATPCAVFNHSDDQVAGPAAQANNQGIGLVSQLEQAAVVAELAGLIASVAKFLDLEEKLNRRATNLRLH
jgi:hypothetical protein